MPVALHPHQKIAVNKMHNGCVLYGDVGVGKTITSLGYYFEKVAGGVIGEWGSMTTPKDIYVITTATVRDKQSFEQQAAHFGISANPENSTNGVKITVDSWNNLHKYVEVKDAFFIFDEQRVVGYGAWARAFIKIAKSNEWVLLSATPGDTWMDYIPVFIANGWYKHKTDFVDQHVVWTPRVKYPKVLRYQNVAKLVQQRNDVLVAMPYERHTTRHPVDIWCDYNEELFDKVVKKRWHVFEKRPLRDAAELFSVMRKVVNSDASRLNAVQRLLKDHPRLIVFYNFDYELEMLRNLTPSGTSTERHLSEVEKSSGSKANSRSEEPTTPSKAGYWTTDEGQGEEFVPLDGENHWEWLLSPEGQMANGFSSSAESATAEKSLKKSSASPSSSPSGAPSFAISEWNGHKHEQIPTTDSWLYLVQYRAGAEGWNCTETDAMVFYSQTYSYRDFFQSHGRIDRLNTPYTDLYYYYLISRSIIDKAIRKALKAKKSFNEKDLDLAA